LKGIAHARVHRWLPAAWLGAMLFNPSLGAQTSGELVVTRNPLGNWSSSREATERGLRFLQSEQKKDSGAVGGQYKVAVTSLTGLAILGAGYQPSQAPYGHMLVKCSEYLEGSWTLLSPGRVYFTEGEDGESKMHGHCYAVLFLCELLGSLPEEDEAKASELIKGAVAVIEGAQSSKGGWFYNPNNRGDEDEASVTVCALQALRAARNVGFLVDSTRVASAIGYVKSCQDKKDGSFAYSISNKEMNRTTYALSVAALSTLNAAGVYSSPELRRGFDYLKRELETVGSPWKVADPQYDFYANLYAAQTLYQDGGALWTEWYPPIRQYLLSKQKADGSWESRFGSDYATAVALLILEIPLGYLPIFQR